MSKLLLTILLLAVYVVVAADDYKKITIEKGIVLRLTKFEDNRSLPHSYYDQAVASIPNIYPEYIFFAKRRYGKLGKTQYSIVCYKENKKTLSVTISGIAVLNNEAWHFETNLPEDSFGDFLLIVLEAIENLPSNVMLKNL